MYDPPSIPRTDRVVEGYRQESDTKNENVENFRVAPDGMSAVAGRIFQLTNNDKLSADDRLDMIREYCVLIIKSQPV